MLALWLCLVLSEQKAAAPPEPEEDANEAFGEWEGERNEEGLPFGKGTAKYPNGDTYEGIIRNNMREDKGVYTWKSLEEGKSGGLYEGEYESNKKHGKGTMKYPDGGTYEGERAIRQPQQARKSPGISNPRASPPLLSPPFLCRVLVTTCTWVNAFRSRQVTFVSYCRALEGGSARGARNVQVPQRRLVQGHMVWRKEERRRNLLLLQRLLLVHWKLD